MEGGFINAALAGSNVSSAGAFAVGFVSMFTQEALYLNGAGCFVSGAVGGAMLDLGNEYLEHGSKAFSAAGLGKALVVGLVSGLISSALRGSCFIAGTPVLLGDGKTKEVIDVIHVGQRVATDGGVANSADSKTKSADPNATEVDPNTWRLVTIITSDLHVGESVRTANGDVTVASLTREPGLYRVYNMTIEADHDYYVGDLTALTHNDCSSESRELRDSLIRGGQMPGKGDFAAHIVPSGEFAGEMHTILEKVGIAVGDAENGFFTNSARHNGTHTDEFPTTRTTPRTHRARRVSLKSTPWRKCGEGEIRTPSYPRFWRQNGVFRGLKYGI